VRVMRKLTFAISVAILGLVALMPAGCKARLKSTSEAVEWFKAHSNEVFRLNAILIAHPAISRVDPGIRLEFVTKNFEFDGETRKTYAECERVCESLGIINIAVYGIPPGESGGWFAIRYVLDSEGNVTTQGSSISVEYRTGAGRRAISEETITSLGVKDWYVVRWQSRD
jgi:hypothetical protein